MRINFYDVKLAEGGRPSLVKEKAADCSAGGVREPEDNVLLARDVLGLNEKAEEHLYMLSLDSAGKITGAFLVSKGTVNASLASPREIFIRALLSGAVQIVLLHNHPSGRAVPTQHDINLTERIKKAGELLNVPLVDHIIIGSGKDGEWLSFLEEGIL